MDSDNELSLCGCCLIRKRTPSNANWHASRRTTHGQCRRLCLNTQSIPRSTRWRAPLAVRLIYSPITYPRCVRNRLKSSEIYVKHTKKCRAVCSICVFLLSLLINPCHHPSPITTPPHVSPTHQTPSLTTLHVSIAQERMGRHIVFSQTRTAKQQRSPHLRKRGINITATWPASLARCLLTNNALIPIPHAACRLAATMRSRGTRGHAARSPKRQTP